MSLGFMMYVTTRLKLEKDLGFGCYLMTMTLQQWGVKMIFFFSFFLHILLQQDGLEEGRWHKVFRECPVDGRTLTQGTPGTSGGGEDGTRYSGNIRWRWLEGRTPAQLVVREHPMEMRTLTQGTPLTSDGGAMELSKLDFSA
jgi:hypothetical protein